MANQLPARRAFEGAWIDSRRASGCAVQEVCDSTTGRTDKFLSQAQGGASAPCRNTTSAFTSCDQRRAPTRGSSDSRGLRGDWDVDALRECLRLPRFQTPAYTPTE